MSDHKKIAKYHNERIDDSDFCNANDGKVALSKTKLFWLGSMLLISIIGGVLTFSLEAFLVFVISTAVSLCLGHSLGMHRKLIHQSYQCPLWLEYIFVHLGVIVGLAGPIGMIKTHDIRDWAQRQHKCHDYFGHKQPMLIDAYWQLFCDIQLGEPPKFLLEDRVKQDRLFNFMESTWMLQQLPWALLFFLVGGIPWVIWGVCMRVSVSVLGHWFIGYFAHNQGERHWHVKDAHVQGHNVRFAAILTMGESWHNNHHAYPGSAKLGIKSDQSDLGWTVLMLLQKLGLVWALVLPQDLPYRPELENIEPT
jgi:stearoyl-CoA desaturase (delta-9 desaturase)